MKVAAKKGIAGLAMGALGVVFGDIGTSPLYALQAIFGAGGQQIAVSSATVYGIISLIIWSVVIVVAVKYIGFVMRADNEGEGGIMALVALLKKGGLGKRAKWLFVLLGLAGVALFYGDSMITPAISVLAAVEGLRVTVPGMDMWVVPVTLAILTTLFAIQKYGTAWIGKLFGPVMLVWFVVIGVGGGWQVWLHPDALAALSPLAAVDFFATQPVVAFVAMGAVVLAVTGAEALYADMGHFGRGPIARAWFFVVFPALILCYMGQGALLLHQPGAAANVFVQLYPEALRLPVVILATCATLIASQSVISGAFSLTRQAIQLGFLPKMLVRHTSLRAPGQIYVPFVNAVLFGAVLLLVVYFGSSAQLAHAYGVAVSGTLAIDTILFGAVVYSVWRWPLRRVALVLAGFLAVDLLFVAATMPKLLSGGWFPVGVAIAMLVILTTWTRGQRIVAGERRAQEGPLQAYIEKIHTMQPHLQRVPGRAVYISHHARIAPLALHATVEELRELHEKVVVIFVRITNTAHVPEHKRAAFDNLAYNDGISYLSLTYGYHDVVNIPKTLESLRGLSPELDFDPNDASYFVSQSSIVITNRRNLARWRKQLYVAMARNATNADEYYKLPVERTMEMRSLIRL